MKSYLLIRHLLTCILLILFIYTALPAKGFAQSVPQQFLDVSPAIQNLHLTPGEKTTYPLTITNKGDKPVGFHIDITGIDPTADSIQNYSLLSSPFLSWISITPTDLIVPPHEKKQFSVSITTPQNAKPSGYYATLFLTPFISNPLKASGPLILERIGTLLLTTVGNLDYNNLARKVHITDFSYSPKQIAFTVKNNYFTHFTAKPFLDFTSTLDKEKRLFPEEKHILPGSSRTWTVPIHAPWYTIYSQVMLRISVGDGQQITSQITYINYLLLMEVVLGVCFMLLILKRSKQFKKALLILLSGKE